MLYCGIIGTLFPIPFLDPLQMEHQLISRIKVKGEPPFFARHTQHTHRTSIHAKTSLHRLLACREAKRLEYRVMKYVYFYHVCRRIEESTQIRDFRTNSMGLVPFGRVVYIVSSKYFDVNNLVTVHSREGTLRSALCRKDLHFLFWFLKKKETHKNHHTRLAIGAWSLPRTVPPNRGGT